MAENITEIANQTIVNNQATVAAGTRIIPWVSDWVLFLFIAIIAIIVYSYLPSEIKQTTKEFLKKYGIYIAIFLAWLYFRNKWGFVYEFPEKWPADMRRATFFAVFALMLFQLAKWLMYEQRYYTRAFVSNGVSGSCNRFQEVGDWIVFFIGTTGSSTEKLVIPFPIPQKIVVAPRVAVDYLGEPIVCKSLVSKVDVTDLPEEVRDFIEKDTFGRIAKENVWFGIWDQEIRTSNPRYDEIELLLKKYNSRVNELSDMLKGKLKTVKGYVSDTLAMTDKLKGKSWKSRASPGLEGNE